MRPTHNAVKEQSVSCSVNTLQPRAVPLFVAQLLHELSTMQRVLRNGAKPRYRYTDPGLLEQIQVPLKGRIMWQLMIKEGQGNTGMSNAIQPLSLCYSEWRLLCVTKEACIASLYLSKVAS